MFYWWEGKGVGGERKTCSFYNCWFEVSHVLLRLARFLAVTPSLQTSSLLKFSCDLRSIHCEVFVCCFRSLGAAKKLIGAASIRRELQRLIQKKLTGEDDFLKDCSWGKVRTAARKLVPRRLGDGLNHTGFAQHCLNYFALALGWYGGALGSSAWQQKGWSALKSCLTQLLGSSGEKANPCQISGCI